MSAPSYTLSDFRNFAQSTFAATTGNSPLVMGAYKGMSSSFLSQPMTPSNVGKFVDIENSAVLRGKSTRFQDSLAKVMTPFRRPVAHLVAQNATVGRHGYFANNEYSREALMSVLSGTF